MFLQVNDLNSSSTTGLPLWSSLSSDAAFKPLITRLVNIRNSVVNNDLRYDPWGVYREKSASFIDCSRRLYMPTGTESCSETDGDFNREWRYGAMSLHGPSFDVLDFQVSKEGLMFFTPWLCWSSVALLLSTEVTANPLQHCSLLRRLFNVNTERSASDFWISSGFLLLVVYLWNNISWRVFHSFFESHTCCWIYSRNDVRLFFKGCDRDLALISGGLRCQRGNMQQTWIRPRCDGKNLCEWVKDVRAEITRRRGVTTKVVTAASHNYI